MNYFAYFYCYNLFKYTTLNFTRSNKNKTFFIGLYRFILFLYFLYKQENQANICYDLTSVYNGINYHDEIFYKIRDYKYPRKLRFCKNKLNLNSINLDTEYFTFNI